jgi:hypothetical protein
VTRPRTESRSSTPSSPTSARFDAQYARDAGASFWTNTVFDPGVENQYEGQTVYARGAMTLHAHT